MAKTAEDTDAKFVVALGDNFYENGVEDEDSERADEDDAKGGFAHVSAGDDETRLNFYDSRGKVLHKVVMEPRDVDRKGRKKRMGTGALEYFMNLFKNLF